MDSITQITLGAAVGEAVLGKKIGNKAMIWGGIGGTIPDLDVLFFPFLDSISKLSFHRGASHAFFFEMLFIPLIAYGVWRWYRDKSTANYKDWVLLFMGSILTHPILDAFTTYGTQLWLPFSRERVAISSIFVADPLYTVPFLLCLIIASRFHRTSQKRRFINYLGLGLSSAYLLFTVFNKFHVNDKFEEALQAQNITYTTDRLITSPTPLNNIMWYGLAEAEDGYYAGLYSLLDTKNAIEFKFIPRNEKLIGELEETRAIKELKWFSKDYYTIEKKENGNLVFVDLRFGLISGWNAGDKSIYPFFFNVLQSANNTLEVVQDRTMDFDIGKVWDDFLERVKGR